MRSGLKKSYYFENVINASLLPSISGYTHIVYRYPNTSIYYLWHFISPNMGVISGVIFTAYSFDYMEGVINGFSFNLPPQAHGVWPALWICFFYVCRESYLDCAIWELMLYSIILYWIGTWHKYICSYLSWDKIPRFSPWVPILDEANSLSKMMITRMLTYPRYIYTSCECTPGECVPCIIVTLKEALHNHWYPKHTFTQF